jgi:hypothetical protein
MRKQVRTTVRVPTLLLTPSDLLLLERVRARTVVTWPWHRSRKDCHAYVTVKHETPATLTNHSSRRRLRGTNPYLATCNYLLLFLLAAITPVRRRHHSTQFRYSIPTLAPCSKSEEQGITVIWSKIVVGAWTCNLAGTTADRRKAPIRNLPLPLPL